MGFIRHLLRLSYLGTNYCGFQVQPNGITVQATLQAAATRLFLTPCGITGCSRTDSGVHAMEYYAVLEEHSEVSISESALPRAMNTYLPKDIAVFESRTVDDDFSLRRHVAGKEYMYLLWNGAVREPFYVGRAFHYPRALDFPAMERALPYFIGSHDFRAFMASGSDIIDTVRNVSDLRIEREGELVRFYITADGFLYNMVRIIVGTLLEVSEGLISPERLTRAIEGGLREDAGRTAPPDGLYLHKVFLM